MIQLLLHFLGDYILQNDWMAQKKTENTGEGYYACHIHCILYTIPFVLVLGISPWQSAIIFTTHFLIDKYRLAQYWIKFINWNWKSTNFGFDNSKPQYMSVWLLIIVDNFFHVLINYLVI